MNTELMVGLYLFLAILLAIVLVYIQIITEETN